MRFVWGEPHFENHFIGVSQNHWLPDILLYLVFLPCCKSSVVFTNIISRNLEHMERVVNCLFFLKLIFGCVGSLLLCVGVL